MTATDSAAPPTVDAMTIARELILRPSGLDDARLDRVFGEVLAHCVDAADLYFQLAREEAWSLEDGIVKDGSASIEQGVGVRALAGEKTGFAYSDEIILPALEQASRAARAIAVQGGERRRVQAWQARAGHELYLAADPATALTDQEKVAWLERVDRETRKLDQRIVHVNASVTALHEVVLIATSEGELAADVRPLVRINVSVLVEQHGRREQGYAGAGGRFSLAELVAGDRPLQLGREALRQALSISKPYRRRPAP
jgi:TldD protein